MGTIVPCCALHLLGRRRLALEHVQGVSAPTGFRHGALNIWAPALFVYSYTGLSRSYRIINYRVRARVQVHATFYDVPLPWDFFVGLCNKIGWVLCKQGCSYSPFQYLFKVSHQNLSDRVERRL